MSETKEYIAVIGGGAAGLAAACFASDFGAPVTVFERNPVPGKKLMITGKGRCNLTNSCSPSDFIANVTTNAKFLYGAINQFSPADTVSYFEALGVPLKTERGNRVFPISDNARDIQAALLSRCRRNGVRFITERVTSLEAEADGYIKAVKTASGIYSGFSGVILATGGASYPLTGSTGDGYKIASALGHSVTPLHPSLVPLTTVESCAPLQGLSLKNVGLKIIDNSSDKTIYEDFGEMLFTHFGLSGPMILSASAHLKDMKPKKYSVSISLKPALDDATLERRILSDFDKYKNKNLSNALSDLLPAKMILPFIAACGLDEYKKINSITKAEREAIIQRLRDFRLTVSGFRPLSEAIITRGGVSVKEIEPSTLKSKLIKNLYFAGEIIDCDAYTGGFNLQIAFSTAFSAAKAASV